MSKVEYYQVTEGGGLFKCDHGDMVFRSDYDASESARVKAAGECERLRTAIAIKAGAGEPAAAQSRWRHPQKTMPDWSAWTPAEVRDSRAAWAIDGTGYEVEYRLLYTTPPTAPDVSGLVSALRQIIRLPRDSMGLRRIAYEALAQYAQGGGKA